MNFIIEWYSDYCEILLRNSATVMAVAMAALRDSEPGSSAGNGGIYSLTETILSIDAEMPSDSFPMTITDGFADPLSRSLS